MSNLNDDIIKQTSAGNEGKQGEDKLQKISKDIDAIANKLELIDNSFSDYVYSDPVYPEVNLDEVLDKLENLNQDMKKDVADLPGISQSLGKMNMHFYTVVQHLNRITDKIILFEEELSIIKKTVTLLAEHIAAEAKESPDKNPNNNFEDNSNENQKEASEELLNKVMDLSAKLSKLELNIHDLLNSSLTSMKTDMGRRLDTMEQNAAKNRALTVGIIISILLNIIVIAMQFI